MDEPSDRDKQVEEGWRSFLEKGEFKSEIRQRRFFRYLPSDPRCKFCNAPFRGPGGVLCRVLLNKAPSKLNPRLCNVCERYAAANLGGAEIELSMLFADVRGSTTLAEQMSTTEFSRLISRFYRVATDVMVNADALVDKLIGDEVTALYTPGFVRDKITHEWRSRLPSCCSRSPATRTRRAPGCRSVRAYTPEKPLWEPWVQSRV